MRKINEAIKRGVGFGLTSGTITTLGLMTGLTSSTGSKMVVISGIITIAIADACSDALGSHISEESADANDKNVWNITIATFLTKFLFALTFLIPVIFLDGIMALIINTIWGFLVITILSYKLAKSNNDKPMKIIAEHLFMAIVVIILSYYVGFFVSKLSSK